MDNKALEEFFAKASDMLSDWNPDPIAEPDVMHAKAPEPGTEHELAPAGESYYEQRAAAVLAEQPALPVCPGCREPDCPVSLLMLLVGALDMAGEVMLLAALAAESVNEQAPTEES